MPSVVVCPPRGSTPGSTAVFYGDALSVNGGPWTRWNGFSLPVGGEAWLSDVRQAVRDSSLLSRLPDGHVISGDEHDLVVRSGAALRSSAQLGGGLVCNDQGAVGGHRPNERCGMSGGMTANNPVGNPLSPWLGRQDSNLGMTVPKSVVHRWNRLAFLLINRLVHRPISIAYGEFAERPVARDEARTSKRIGGA